MTSDVEKYSDQLRRATAQREVGWIEAERARERYEKQRDRPRAFRESGRPKDFWDLLNGYAGGKAKFGRPSIWRGHEGYFLAKAVEEIRAEDKRCSLKGAISRALKTHPSLKNSKAIHRMKGRALEARYQQAADFWADASKPNCEKNGRFSSNSSKTPAM